VTNPEQPPAPLPPVPAPPYQPYPLSGGQPPAYPAPYAPPVDPRYGQLIQAPAPKQRSGLGVVALILALAAAVAATAVLAIASFQIGAGIGPRIETLAARPGELGFLTPVREWVLAAEIAFWTGTVLGIASLILGIVATVKRRGRGAGIAAIVFSAIGPLLAGGAVIVAASLGAATTIPLS